MQKVLNQEPTQIHGLCPSCKTMTNYNLLGIQCWPEAVAKNLGVPVQQEIWQCENCKTSLMRDSIKIEDNSLSA